MADLPKSIALHIGAHKTASSHLQNLLHSNRKMIAEQGIRVFGPRYLRSSGRDLATMFDLSWSGGPAPRRTPLEQLSFLAKGKDRLVLTEENFAGTLIDNAGRTPLPIYPAGAARIEELVSKLAPVETQLFLALRNPASFITSTYSQALFAKVYVGPRTFRANNNWRLVDWAEYVARLRSIPGVSKIFVWRHEDYEAAQRLVLRRLLRWSVGRKIKQSSGRVHQGMSVEAVRQTLELAQSGQTGALASDARKAFPVSDTHKRFQLYAPSTLMEATQIYEEQIARIGQIDGVTLLRMRKAVHKA